MLLQCLHHRDPIPQCWGTFRNSGCIPPKESEILAKHYFFLLWKNKSLESGYEDKVRVKQQSSSRPLGFPGNRNTVETKMSLRSGWSPLLATNAHAAPWANVLSKKITVPQSQVILKSPTRGSLDQLRMHRYSLKVHVCLTKRSKFDLPEENPLRCKNFPEPSVCYSFSYSCQGQVKLMNGKQRAKCPAYSGKGPTEELSLILERWDLTYQ